MHVCSVNAFLCLIIQYDDVHTILHERRRICLRTERGVATRDRSIDSTTYDLNMAPRLVRYFAYSGGIAAIFALLYYSYYFSVQVPGEFLFEGGREVFSNWSSPKLTPFFIIFLYK